MRQINRSIQTCQQCFGCEKRRVPQRTSTLTTDCSLGSRLTEQNIDRLPEEPIAATPFKQSMIVEQALCDFGPIQKPGDIVPTGAREGWGNSKWWTHSEGGNNVLKKKKQFYFNATVWTYDEFTSEILQLMRNVSMKLTEKNTRTSIS